MCATRVSVETLKAFEPIGSLPDARLNDLAGHCQLETIAGTPTRFWFAASPVRRSIFFAASSP